MDGASPSPAGCSKCATCPSVASQALQMLFRHLFSAVPGACHLSLGRRYGCLQGGGSEILAATPLCTRSAGGSWAWQDIIDDSFKILVQLQPLSPSFSVRMPSTGQTQQRPLLTPSSTPCPLHLYSIFLISAKTLWWIVTRLGLVSAPYYIKERGHWHSSAGLSLPGISKWQPMNGNSSGWFMLFVTGALICGGEPLWCAQIITR